MTLAFPQLDRPHSKALTVSGNEELRRLIYIFLNFLTPPGMTIRVKFRHAQCMQRVFDLHCDYYFPSYR